jgi:hypothetical protein
MCHNRGKHIYLVVLTSQYSFVAGLFFTRLLVHITLSHRLRKHHFRIVTRRRVASFLSLSLYLSLSAIALLQLEKQASKMKPFTVIILLILPLLSSCRIRKENTVYSEKDEAANVLVSTSCFTNMLGGVLAVYLYIPSLTP